MRRPRLVGDPKENQMYVLWTIYTSEHRALNVYYEDDDEFVASLEPKQALALIWNLLCGLVELAFIRTPKEWKERA